MHEEHARIDLKVKPLVCLLKCIVWFVIFTKVVERNYSLTADYSKIFVQFNEFFQIILKVFSYFTNIFPWCCYAQV